MTAPRSATLVLLIVALAGCQSGPLAGLAWSPFPQKDRTTYETPKLRMEAAMAIGEQATGEDTPDQQQHVVDLARRIQAEPDPLVRESVLSATARFQTPLASQVLVAALADTDPLVRRRACRLLGRRGDPTAVPALAKLIRTDKDLDVQIEATRALGGIASPETNAALVAALEAQDPALQFAGVTAMKQCTGRDFGGDVKACLAYARGETPPAAEPPSAVASRVERWLPF